METKDKNMEKELMTVLKDLVSAIDDLNDGVTAAIESQNQYLFNIEKRLDDIERKL